MQDKDRCNRMVTGNIIKCSKEDFKRLDKNIKKENWELMKLIKKGKREEIRKKQSKEKKRKEKRKRRKNSKRRRKKKRKTKIIDVK